MISRASQIFGLILFLLPPLSGQVVFSRRVYKESGPSYQQIWNWNPADNSLKQLTDSARDHFLPSCSGQRVLFVSPREWQANAKLWSFDRNTGNESITGPVPPERDKAPARLPGCDVSAVAGPLEACGKRGELSISRGGTRAGSLRAGDDFCPIQLLAWSPSGKWLLVGTLGAGTNSTSPQSDLFVLEPAAMKLTKVGSGNAETWLPARDVFSYTSPRDMASLAGARRERGVWVEHLMVYKPASGTTTAITSGVTNNVQPNVCGK
jgi:Tol biopolymer transport system component